MKGDGGKGLGIMVAATLLLGAEWRPAQAQQGSPAGQASASASETDASTALVAAVRIVTDDGRVLSDQPQGLPISIGKPLNRDEIAGSIRTLYRSGDYADVRAIATPLDGGVRIDFVVREQLYFNQVIIQGLVSPPTEASAIAPVQLPPREPHPAHPLNQRNQIR